MLNIYNTQFSTTCPVNGVLICYDLTIKTKQMIKVEDILAKLGVIASAPGFHEPVADDLHATFGGSQILVAHHHGVNITTLRGE
jgi:hypothetical protein